MGLGATVEICNHEGYRRYRRRVFSNGSVHVCVQCEHCLALVKLAEHGFRPFLRLDEVPAGRNVSDWVEPGNQQELI
jgi:hypothetical protein